MVEKKYRPRIALTPARTNTLYRSQACATGVRWPQSLERRLTIAAAVAAAIMVVNLLVMLVARRLLPVLSIAMPIFGAVLGIVQVALGLQIIHNVLHTLGVL
jgi:small neutral amino acid transporter SnatA (MarC family)